MSDAMDTPSFGGPVEGGQRQSLLRHGWYKRTADYFRVFRVGLGPVVGHLGVVVPVHAEKPGFEGGLEGWWRKFQDRAVFCPAT